MRRKDAFLIRCVGLEICVCRIWRIEDALQTTRAYMQCVLSTRSEWIIYRKSQCDSGEEHSLPFLGNIIRDKAKEFAA
jgi:hypothetical protein